MSGDVAVSRFFQASADLFDWWVRHRFLKRAMLTFHYLPANTGLDVEPSPEQLVNRTKRTLISYNRYTGDFIPLEGVVSPEDNEDDGTPGWPHIHVVLQRCGRDPEAPVVNPERLIAHGRANWLKVTYSLHPKLRDSADETDLRYYVARHLDRHGSEYLPGRNIVTNFDRPEGERVLRDAARECHRARKD